MATDIDEVLRRADRWIESAQKVGVAKGALVTDLAAALREARRDSERLDFAIRHGLVRVWHGEPGQRYSREADRRDLDVAMMAADAKGAERQDDGR